MRRLSINKIRMSENLLYGLLWSAVFLVPMLNAVMTTSLKELDLIDLLSAWLKIIPYFIIFLIHNAQLAPLLFRRSYIYYLLLDSALIVTIFVFVDYAQEYLLPILRISLFEDMQVSASQHGEVSFTHLSIFWNSLIAIHMSAANLAVKLLYKSMRDEQSLSELAQHNLQVEMDYLKYQINPHFFMNTLNNIHALIDIDKESAKSTVIELSKMMRYVLYESGNESISLRNDLQFITNYIKLMKIRYDENIEVRTLYPEKIPSGWAIPPLLLIVFVENAFKHGVGSEGESYIHIEISLQGEERLTCRVANSIPPQHLRKVGDGIGLINVRRRLELLYGDNFTLSTSATESEYTVNLTIPIK